MSLKTHKNRVSDKDYSSFYTATPTKTTSTNLLWAEFVGSCHKMRAYHWEGNDVAMLSGKFEALFKLFLKQRSVEAKQYTLQRT